MGDGNSAPGRTGPHIGLFVTCLVDLFRPVVGFAAVKLLEDAGCRVTIPPAQTCCGQPAYNSGDRRTAQKIARQIVEEFEAYDYVVAPSGSCAAMVRLHVPKLLGDDLKWAKRAEALGDKTFELVSFLTDILGVDKVDARLEARATYHDSCAGLRELGIKTQPRQLLETVEGLRIEELEGAEICCGFGGTFSVKFPDVSNAIVSEKTADIQGTGAELLLAGDLGCLMNMAGKLSRMGSSTGVRHVAEVLADMCDQPPIGHPTTGGEK